MDDIIDRLLKRAEIRRQISTRKSVQEGKPDRISDLLEEAAKEIQMLRALKDIHLMNTSRPLKQGTLIDYCGEIAEVVLDDGGSKITVKIDDTIQAWYWKFEGIECKVVDSGTDDVEYNI